MKNKNITFIEAIATLVGTIIGAGVLGIPYALNQTGFFPGLILLVLIAIAIMMVNLFLGEVVLRTKESRQLSGYAEIYLGKWAKVLMSVFMTIGIYGAMIAYLIGEGEALKAIFGGSEVMWSLIFWGIGAAIIYIGLHIVKVFELVMMGIILSVIILIAVFSAGHVSAENIFFMDMTKFASPYGVVFFAYLGATAIQQVREILRGNEKKMKSAIILSSFIPLIVYALFAFIVIGVSGINTTQVATVGLGEIIGPKMILFGNIFAIFAMGTSFLTLSLALKNTFDLDYKMKNTLAWALTVFVPILAFLLGVKDFIKTIAFVGAFVGGIEGILILIIYWKAKKKGRRKPEYSYGRHYVLGAVLILMFVLGMIYTLL